MPRIKNLKIAKRRQKIQQQLGSVAASLGAAHPQPAVRPVRNNRIVFLLGFITGSVITLWLTLFLIRFLPMVFR
jgi:hypothetical protein